MRFKRSYYFLAIGVLPFLFLLQNPKINDPLHKLSYTLIKPMILGGHFVATSASEIREKIVYFWNTFQDQGQQEQRIAELIQKLEDFEEIKRENGRLKQILDFKESVPTRTLAAKVIGWDISPWRKVVILDKGSLQGLKKDMAVIVPAGLVGRILDISPTTARVILLTDPDSRVAALGEQSRAQGIVVGSGSSRLTTKYFEMDSGIAVGETVLTSGMGGIFPKGLAIGRIEGVARDPNGLYLTAEIQPLVNFSKLEEVLCLEYFQPE